ncbi:MAG: hypothetical protein NVSMB64_29930 [Candidatus Velthaea sp.]
MESNSVKPLARLLTVRDVADRTGLSRQYIYNIIDRGQLPAHRFGAAVRVDSNDLETFIAAQRTLKVN